jgi:hypothetical protein
MNFVAKSIRQTTGLTMAEFCAKYLDSEWRTFSVRLRKLKLYPNEVLLICLLTGKTTDELFETSAIETFCLRGKDSVNNEIRKFISKPNAADAVSKILGGEVKLSAPAIRKPVPHKKVKSKRIIAPKPAKTKESDFDFLDADIFKKKR